MMRFFIAAVLCILMPVASFASETSYKVSYDGGSIPDLKTGSSAKLFIEAKQIRLVQGNKELVTIPASAVTEISYGQDVHRRIGTAIGLATISLGVGALMMFSKSKKHFVGITWSTGDAKGGFVMQCDKNDYRGVLMGLEGVTGKKSVNSDAMTVKN